MGGEIAPAEKREKEDQTMKKITFEELENTRVNGTGFSAEGKGLRELSGKLGAIHTLLKIDVLDDLVRPSDVNKYLVYFGTGEKVLFHINETSEIESAELTYYYCNPCAHGRSGAAGRVNHYIIGEIVITLSNGDKLRNGVMSIKESSKAAAMDVLVKRHKQATGNDLREVNKKVNLDVFLTIYNLSKSNKYRNTNAYNVRINLLNMLEETINDSIAALEKAKFIEIETIKYNRNGMEQEFTTIKPTENGIKRLQNVM